MHLLSRLGLAAVVLGLAAGWVAAQGPAPAAPGATPSAAPAAAAKPAAVVNGQAIAETAVQRGLLRVPADRKVEARVALLDFLIDNVLVDQYLAQLKISADKKDVDARVEQIKEEIKKQPGQTVEKVLGELMLTDAELQTQVEADLRWEKFAAQQATEPELRKFFDANREAFDGTQVKARHILLSPPWNDAKAVEQALAQLQQFRKQAEGAAAAALAKLPQNSEPLAREKARTEALEQTFLSLAKENSTCPTKKNGGDVDWFPRSGGMVEPFARAAFGLKPFEMSDPVRTQFGMHLILVTDRKPGKEVKFDDVKSDVKEYYCDRLREAVIALMRPRATISVTPAAPTPPTPPVPAK